MTRLLGRLRSACLRAVLQSALRAFANATSGNAAIDYALCVGGVGAMGVGGFTFIGTELADLFHQVSQQVCLTTHFVCVG